MEKIYLASDHGGFKLKEQLKIYFERQKIAYQDLGPKKYQPTDDYPDYAYPLAKKVAAAKSQGILICRNGIGVCIVANKVKGVRAVSTISPKIAKTSRADDDTNVLCLGQDFTNLTQAKKVTDVWLKTKFSGATRHKRRLNKIKKIENKKYKSPQPPLRKGE